jgi:hypothetical protein
MLGLVVPLREVALSMSPVRLHLLDAGGERGYDHELWLARLRPDGIYATSQLGKSWQS